jgi:hypothetical protein
LSLTTGNFFGRVPCLHMLQRRLHRIQRMSCLRHHDAQALEESPAGTRARLHPVVRICPHRKRPVPKDSPRRC